MNVTKKDGNISGFNGSIKPSKEEITKARAQKKERKKERSDLAKAKERDDFTKTHQGAASGKFEHHEGSPYSSHLHPGTISFLKKFRPNIYNQMKADEELLSKEHKKKNSPA